MSSQWTVIDGNNSKGVVVLTSSNPQSQTMKERLATGSVIKQVKVKGQLMNFMLVNGTGPKQGWVSTKSIKKNSEAPSKAAEDVAKRKRSKEATEVEAAVEAKQEAEAAAKKAAEEEAAAKKAVEEAAAEAAATKAAEEEEAARKAAEVEAAAKKAAEEEAAAKQAAEEEAAEAAAKKAAEDEAAALRAAEEVAAAKKAEEEAAAKKAAEEAAAAAAKKAEEEAAAKKAAEEEAAAKKAAEDAKRVAEEMAAARRAAEEAVAKQKAEEAAAQKAAEAAAAAQAAKDIPDGDAGAGSVGTGSATPKGAGSTDQIIPDAVKPPSTCRVEVHCETNFGETLGLVGEDAALGRWDLAGAVRLTTGEALYPKWTAEVTLPATGSEFKFVVFGGDDQASWEPFQGNRRWPAMVCREGHCPLLQAKFGSVGVQTG